MLNVLGCPFLDGNRKQQSLQKVDDRLNLIDQANTGHLLVASTSHFHQRLNVAIEEGGERTFLHRRRCFPIKSLYPRLNEGSPPDVGLVDVENTSTGDGGGCGILQRIDLKYHPHRRRQWNALVRHQG